MNELEAWKATGRRALRVARQQWPARQRALGAALGLGALVGTALLAPLHPLAGRHAPEARPALVRPERAAHPFGRPPRPWLREGRGAPPRVAPPAPPPAPARPVPPAPPSPRPRRLPHRPRGSPQRPPASRHRLGRASTGPAGAGRRRHDPHDGRLGRAGTPGWALAGDNIAESRSLLARAIFLHLPARGRPEPWAPAPAGGPPGSRRPSATPSTGSSG